MGFLAAGCGGDDDDDRDGGRDGGSDARDGSIDTTVPPPDVGAQDMLPPDARVDTALPLDVAPVPDMAEPEPDMAEPEVDMAPEVDVAPEVDMAEADTAPAVDTVPEFDTAPDTSPDAEPDTLPPDMMAAEPQPALMINNCSTYVDRSESTAARTLSWQLSLPGNPARCMMVKVGQTVTWQGSFFAHPLAPWNGDTPNPIMGISGLSPDTYNVTFSTPGTFGYHCNVHPAMQGAIHVVP